MKYLKLFELNKVGQYYKENPNKIRKETWSKTLYKDTDTLPNTYGTSERLLKKVQKLSHESGISVQSLIPAIKAVQAYKLSDKKVIPKPFRRVLRQLTVKPRNIPPILWRGLMLIVPDNISTEDYVKSLTPEFLSNYTKTKCVSWTTDISTAALFMIMNTTGNSYSPKVHVMLKYTNLSYDDIIVDTREIKQLSYGYEKEVILEPSATDFEIYKVFVNEKGYSEVDSPIIKWKEQIDARKKRIS